MSDSKSPKPPLGSMLTSRETQVLWGKAHGLTHRDVGEKIGIDELTVKSHLRRAYARLGANDCAHAVAMCFRMGVFPPPNRVVTTVHERDMSHRPEPEHRPAVPATSAASCENCAELERKNKDLEARLALTLDELRKWVNAG